MGRKPGISYQRRVADINRIYDYYAPKGVPNREIWRRYVYPLYGVSERTFYNALKAASTLPGPPGRANGKSCLSLFDFVNEQWGNNVKEQESDNGWQHREPDKEHTQGHRD